MAVRRWALHHEQQDGHMVSKRKTLDSALALIAAASLSACGDAPTRVVQPTTPAADAVKFWEGLASTRWNQRATELLAKYPPTANGQAQAATSRILTYLSLAQYRAVLAAERGKDRSTHPSVPAAVAAASVSVLSDFFPLAADGLEAQLDDDLAAPGWPGARNEDVAAGLATGRTVAAAVLAQKATDNYYVQSPGAPPVGDGFWIPAPPPTPIVRSLYGARPFFLTSTDQLRPPPPPAFGSPEFIAARDEIRAISDTRTPEQVAIARTYATSTAPFTAGTENLEADQLIVAHHRTEREATRILAYANAAAFDAQIACWDAKFTYWLIRPSQADPGITLVVPLPNHPSYPSAHQCITAAIMSVLVDAFPSERPRLEAYIETAGLSRMYAGLHYRFDVEAGEAIGRQAAGLALAGSLE
jgi:membrane-associated phospholipid phosphatase